MKTLKEAKKSRFCLCQICKVFSCGFPFQIKLNKVDFILIFIGGLRGHNKVIYLAQVYIRSKWKTYNQN